MFSGHQRSLNWGLPTGWGCLSWAGAFLCVWGGMAGSSRDCTVDRHASLSLCFLPRDALCPSLLGAASQTGAVKQPAFSGCPHTHTRSAGL